MATAAQGAQDRTGSGPSLIIHPAARHLTLLLSFIVGFIALANQQQVAIPAATLSITRALDRCSPAGFDNSCLERVRRSVGGVVGACDDSTGSDFTSVQSSLGREKIERKRSLRDR